MIIQSCKILHRIPSLLGVFVLFCLCTTSAHAEPASSPLPAPIPNAAYFEAGPYWEFSLIFKEVKNALSELGVLHSINFPSELHISPGWGASTDTYRLHARKLMNDPSVDIIFSMGTAATKALLAENNGVTPIMSIDVADPIGAGILDAQTGKGAKNLTIQYIKDKWFQVFSLFHEALPFRRLGIMYHNSPDGLSYSNIREAREVARERGFELVEYSLLDKEESTATCTKGVKTLTEQGIDAFYISALNCFDWTQVDPRPLLSTLNDKKIKTFARDGSIHVERGALMGLSTLDYAPLGKFYADRAAWQLGLLSPNTVLEKESYKPKITLNMVTASKLGITLPLYLLISADEIFDSTLADIQSVSTVQ